MDSQEKETNPVCEYIIDCAFYIKSAKTLPDEGEEVKSAYCFGDYPKCSRLLVRQAIGVENVPDDMRPDDNEMAEQILEKAGNSNN